MFITPGCAVYAFLHSTCFICEIMMMVWLQGEGPERLVTGSDDFTLYLWNPESEKKPLTRMTGHQQTINQVCGYLSF